MQHQRHVDGGANRVQPFQIEFDVLAANGVNRADGNRQRVDAGGGDELGAVFGPGQRTFVIDDAVAVPSNITEVKPSAIA